MNKKEVVWLIIRLIGVYFAYLAVVSILSLFGSIYSYASLPNPTPSPKSAAETSRTRPTPPPVNSPAETDAPVTKAETDTSIEKAKSEAFKLIFWFVLSSVIYGLAGWYFIRDGKYLFVILNKEEANAEEKEIPQVTSLNL